MSSRPIIYNIFVISKSGGLIYDYETPSRRHEVEKTYSYPLQLKLVTENRMIVVKFGHQDGLQEGHALLAINGSNIQGTKTPKGQDIYEFLKDENNYPLNLKFGRPPLTTNEKIILASMFYPLFAFAVQLSPDKSSSGIEELETDSFKLFCKQTITGIKFLAVTDIKTSRSVIEQLLRQIYILYSDYTMKNPFYNLEMPIRTEKFNVGIIDGIRKIEKDGYLDTQRNEYKLNVMDG